jgi:hypothetical protein
VSKVTGTTLLHSPNTSISASTSFNIKFIGIITPSVEAAAFSNIYFALTDANLSVIDSMSAGSLTAITPGALGASKKQFTASPAIAGKVTNVTVTINQFTNSLLKSDKIWLSISTLISGQSWTYNSGAAM